MPFGPDPTEAASAWIIQFATGYNITGANLAGHPTSSVGHVLGRQFGGVGALGNITPLKPTSNQKHATEAENPLANMLRSYNLTPGYSVCVVVWLGFDKKQTPDRRIPDTIHTLGIVAGPLGGPLYFPAPSIDNT